MEESKQEALAAIAMKQEFLRGFMEKYDITPAELELFAEILKREAEVARLHWLRLSNQRMYDSVLTYAEQHLTPASDAVLLKRDFYSGYADFCHAHDLTVAPEDPFFSQLRQIFKAFSWGRTAGDVDIRGIAIRKSCHAAD